MNNLHLARLLEDGQQYAPSYGGGLSNHLPMTLIALHAMGADAAQLDSQVERYATRLEPLHEGDVTVDAVRFERHLGDWSANAAYRRFFVSAINENGIAQTLAAWWPTLAPGVAAAGFHGLIRLAYGLQAESAAEQASGLAYLASAHTPLITNASRIADAPASVSEGLKALHAAFAGRKIEAGRIIEELRLATEEPEFFPHLHVPLLDSATACAAVRVDLAHYSVRLYLVAPSFNSLHLITGAHALEVVLDSVPAAMHARSIAHFWVAFCAAYIGIGAPTPGDVPAVGNVSNKDWEAVVAAALQTTNDHTIKLIYTCRALSARHGDAAYLAAARHAATTS